MQDEDSQDGVYWNKELGIWQDADGKACVKVLKELDAGEPLYVFGYGSLIWRPGDLLECYPSYDVDAIAYQRLFAQRSYDHRGTPRFPGLVLTVHPVDGLDDSAETGKQVPSTCSGRVFLVPEEDREAVMEELDFREKGGYTRTVMGVRMRDGQEGAPHAAGDVFRTVVYYAERSNPLFFDGAAELSEKGIQATANIIAASEGPSGHNSAYLLQLSHYLYHNSPSLTDRYLISLSRSVYYRSCPWNLHSRGLINVTQHCIEDPLSLLGVAQGGDEGTGTLLGWGSNEYSQLQEDPETSGTAFAQAAAVGLMEHSYRVESAMLIAGGGSSGVVDWKSGKLSVWGQVGNLTFHNVRAACMGHAHGLVLHQSGKLLSFGEDSHGQCSKAPDHLQHSESGLGQGLEEQEQERREFVSKAACGLRHSAAIDGLGRLHTWGASKHGQVLEGKERGQGVAPPTLPHHEGDPLEPRFIDVACGARHTLAVDNRGDVWGFGDNRYGILGGDSGSGGDSEKAGLVRISGLSSEVKWVSVKSGWAHAVAKGVKQDGSVVFSCWGRCDLEQLPTTPAEVESGSAGSSKCLKPSPLLALPNKEPGTARITVEAWCGAEHTVAADSEGCLWVSGWDDHSGAGEGEEGAEKTKRSQWSAVLEKGSHARAKVMHGTVASSHVAAGGAHSLFISES